MLTIKTAILRLGVMNKYENATRSYHEIIYFIYFFFVMKYINTALAKSKEIKNSGLNGLI